MRITLTDEFATPTGEYTGYDAYNNETDPLKPRTRQVLAKQKHTDLRVFQHASIFPNDDPIANLDAETMSSLDGDFMLILQGDGLYIPGELWTVDTVGPDPAYENIRTLRVDLTGTTAKTVYSKMVEPVDLSMYDSLDQLSVALPDFPYTNIDTSQSYLFLEDSTSGREEFYFDQSNPELIAGSSEARWSLTQLFNASLCDPSDIVKVGFVLTPTSSCLVTVMAIRAMTADWKYGKMDYDTRYNRFRRAVPLNGDLSSVVDYTLPILWRSSSPPESDDPRPIDGSIGVEFNTGSMTETNTISVYFRELTEDFMTQLDLDGLSMAELDGRVQPDVGEARYVPVTQDEIGVFDQTELDGRSMFDLERAPDYFSASYVSFAIQWSASGGTVTIAATEGAGYTFDLDGPLEPETSYHFVADLEENVARARLWTMEATYSDPEHSVFDSTEITDSNLFKRRKGRFGWYADLRDGDAYLSGVRERGFIYAEYRSLPFESITPVEGAELFVTNSADKQHFIGLGVSNLISDDYGVNISRDNARSLSGSSWKITNSVANKYLIVSNEFDLYDFQNTEVAFDVYFPGSQLTYRSPAFGLVDQYRSRTFQVTTPTILPDQWQRIHFRMPQNANIEAAPTGRYALIASVEATSELAWWLDNISIFTRSVTWDGRAVVDDPWKSNDAAWTPFGNIKNMANGGVLFPDRGHQLQVRARGLTQDATIQRIQFLPKYSELGNFRRAESTPSVAPAASFTSTPSVGLSVSFTSTATDADGYIAQHEWSFGDGESGWGPKVSHIYPAAGSYTVTLTVTDNNGNKSVYADTVTV
jgi:hypothetical protein